VRVRVLTRLFHAGITYTQAHACECRSDGYGMRNADAHTMRAHNLCVTRRRDTLPIEMIGSIRQAGYANDRRRHTRAYFARECECTFRARVRLCASREYARQEPEMAGIAGQRRAADQEIRSRMALTRRANERTGAIFGLRFLLPSAWSSSYVRGPGIAWRIGGSLWPAKRGS
jgi:hypothetical protein